MSLADNLKIADDVVDDGDRLGGEGYVWNSAIYETVIDLAYLSESANGATGLNLVLKDANGRELKNVLWLTSRKSKGGNTYYVKDDVKHNLKGFNTANALAYILTGKPGIGNLDTTEKTVSLWDYDAKAELNTKVEVYMDLIDERIDVAVLRQIVDKNVQQDDGTWAPGGEVRDVNEIEHFFNPDTGMTMTELKAGDPDPVFKGKWDKKWTGVTLQKAKGATAGTTPGAPVPSATGPSTTKKLFNKAN